MTKKFRPDRFEIKRRAGIVTKLTISGVDNEEERLLICQTAEADKLSVEIDDKRGEVSINGNSQELSGYLNSLYNIALISIQTKASLSQILTPRADKSPAQ